MSESKHTPDLLEALEAVTESLFEEISARYGDNINPAMQVKYDRDIDEVIQARKVIDKARGESDAG